MSKLTIRTRYGVAPNELLNRSDISLRAKGLFVYIQSKPDGWSFSVERIAKQTTEGKDAVRTAIKELEDAGYLTRTAVKNDDGTWGGYDYLLTDTPSAKNPPTENTDTLSKKESSKKEIVRKRENTIPDAIASGEREQFVLTEDKTYVLSNGLASIEEYRGEESSTVQNRTEQNRATKHSDAIASGKKKPAVFNPLGAEIIKAMEEVNPAVKRMYGHVVQRQACDDLIECYGLQTVLEKIRILPKTNVYPYMPHIYTPLQLRDNWQRHEDQINSIRNKQIINKPKVIYGNSTVVC